MWFLSAVNDVAEERKRSCAVIDTVRGCDLAQIKKPFAQDASRIYK
jgi:hypothetical protein